MTLEMIGNLIRQRGRRGGGGGGLGDGEAFGRPPAFPWDRHAGFPGHTSPHFRAFSVPGTAPGQPAHSIRLSWLPRKPSAGANRDFGARVSSRLIPRQVELLGLGLTMEVVEELGGEARRGSSPTAGRHGGKDHLHGLGSVHRPARRSRMASSASRSSLPAPMSSCHCLSQEPASNCSNHWRKRRNSSAGNPETADSISSALLMPSSLHNSMAHAKEYKLGRSPRPLPLSQTETGASAHVAVPWVSAELPAPAPTRSGGPACASLIGNLIRRRGRGAAEVYGSSR